MIELLPVPTKPDYFIDIKYGFIIKLLDDRLFTSQIYVDGIHRELTAEEKSLALSIGLTIQN